MAEPWSLTHPWALLALRLATDPCLEADVEVADLSWTALCFLRGPPLAVAFCVVVAGQLW